MIKRVESFLKKYNIKNKNVLVGFSCGPDSCALAFILSLLKEKYNLNLILAYFNHLWRKEAKQEEEFTKDFAKKIKADFCIGTAPKNSPHTEEAARDLRYNFFQECAKKYDTDIVFLAHNKNDNIETLIYRIIKGTSIKGLCSIPKVRDIYFRPLLETKKSEILDFLKKNDIGYKIDSSNNDKKYKRNLIRLEILPKFEEINPDYINSIERLINHSILARKIIDSEISKIKEKLIINQEIKKDEFIRLDIQYRLEILNDYLGEYLKYRDYKNLKKIDDFIQNENNKKISLNKNSFLCLNDKKIFIETKGKKNTQEILINNAGEYFFEDMVLKIEKFNKEDNNFPNSNDDFCFLQFDFPLTLRHRKNGDIFSPSGLKNGKMKLKDYLINEKIPQTKKDELILLCKDNEVCWVLGNRISEKYKIRSKNCYKLTWRKNG